MHSGYIFGVRLAKGIRYGNVLKGEDELVLNYE